MIQKITNSIYFPMLVSNQGIVCTVPGENEAEWEKLRNLPFEKRDVLMNSEVSFKVKSLQESFHLSDLSIGYISLFIRKIFFQELTLEECEAKIGSMLVTTGGGDPNQARAIVLFIQKEILIIEPKLVVDNEEESAPKRVTISLPILQALSQYEKLGDQLITKERIRIKTQNESVRPSLAYWIKYYRDELGIGHHDSVTVGNFLFRSENGKKLSSEERERVNLLVKSLEENLSLLIDVEHQEIVFPVSDGIPAVATKKMPAQVTGSVDKVNIKQNAPLVMKTPTQEAQKKDKENITNKPSFAFGNQNVASIDTPASKTREIHMKPGLAFHQEVKSAPSSGDNALRFSSSHIFPAEKEILTQTAEVKPLVKTEKKEAKPFVTTKKIVPAIPPQSMAVPETTPKPVVSDDDMNPFIIRPSHRNN